MSADIVCFTSFTYAYVSRARVLRQSLRAVHPEWPVWAVVIDEPPPGVDAAAALGEFDGVLKLADLGIAGGLDWLLRHDVVEACTAVKGQALRLLLKRGAGAVLYFDPDVAVFNRLDPVLAALAGGSIVLTPHQLAPNEHAVAVRDNEAGSLAYGVFNLGFIGVRNDIAGRAFADWWADRLGEACFDDPASGLFTDQKYCDLVPGLFPATMVLRDPGCNVASWNVSRRRLAFDDTGTITVNGAPLRFYHFTKIGGAGDLMTERYGGDNVEVFEVWNWYKRAEHAMRRETVPAGYWHYGRFADGRTISRALRLWWRGRPDLMGVLADPFVGLPGWIEEHEGGRKEALLF